MKTELDSYYVGLRDGEYAITDGEHKNSPWEKIVEFYVYLSARTFAVPEHVVNSTNDKGIDWYRTGYIDGVRRCAPVIQAIKDQIGNKRGH